MTLTMVSMTALALCLVVQQTSPTLTNPTPSDARMNQFDEVRGSSWRVFAVESNADGPIGITEVQEIRQQNPPSKWAVFAQNRSLALVTSFTIAAAIVSGDGNIKAVQPLPAIKNLQPARVSRQEMRVTTTILMPTDRVVFFVNEASGLTGPWKAARADITALVKAAAKLLPVP
jgi:hypothetical protein